MSNEMIKIDDTYRIAKSMAISNLFKGENAEQAFVKILAGQEFGIGPFAAMTGISIIQGKPVLGANLQATLIKNDPRYDYKVNQHTDTLCEIVFYENGDQVGLSAFSWNDAKKAGLINKANWKNYPRNMLFARALSNGAKWYCPGIFGGTPAYTPDEFGLDVDADGDILEGKIVPQVVKIDQPAAVVIIDEKGDDVIVDEPTPAPNGEKPAPQTWPGQFVSIMMKDYGYDHAKHAVAALNQSFILTSKTPLEQLEVWLAARANAKSKGVDGAPLVEDATQYADHALADAIAELIETFH